MPQPVKVASMKELPDGAQMIVDANNVQVALFNVGGTIHAVNNLCPHRGGPLGEGTVENGQVVCPWHGWAFRLEDGALASGTAAVRAQCYKVTVQGEDVLVEI